MAEQYAVIFDRMTIRVEAGGLRLCLEGIVPQSLWPDPDAEFRPESRTRALALIGEAFPELIPAPLIRHTQRRDSIPSECGAAPVRNGSNL
jgi:hypothetical protein